MAVPGSLLASVYEDLRRLAAHQLGREQGGHTLQATALVHEAWLRLDGQAVENWKNRTQFIAVASLSEAMDLSSGLEVEGLDLDGLSIALLK